MKLYFYNKYDGDPSYIFLPQNGFDRLERVDCMGFWSNLFFFLPFLCLFVQGRRVVEEGPIWTDWFSLQNLLILIDIAH